MFILYSVFSTVICFSTTVHSLLSPSANTILSILHSTPHVFSRYYYHIALLCIIYITPYVFSTTSTLFQTWHSRPSELAVEDQNQNENDRKLLQIVVWSHYIAPVKIPKCFLLNSFESLNQNTSTISTLQNKDNAYL